MPNKILLFILLSSISAVAQLQRYDSFAATTASASGIGNLTQVIPNATIQVFNYPGAGISCAAGGCTAATTFTSRTGGTACGAGVPLTRPTANTCLATTDLQGNFGFWAAANQYQYCIVAVPATQCFNVVLGPANDFINGTLYVGGAITTWAGADIGAQINSAYAALPSTGGTIYILPGTYAFTTPIVLATASKPALLAGMSPGGQFSSGVVLNYTPTTATTAIRLDFGTPSGQPIPAAGLRDFALWNNGPSFTPGGSGSSATGIAFGPTNQGALLGTFQNLWIGGFGTGISWPTTSVSFGVKLYNIVAQFNNTAIAFFGQEEVSLYGCYLSSNGTAITSNNGEISVFGGSFDNNTATAINYTNVAGGVAFSCFGCHFETGNGGAGVGAGNVLFISGTPDITLVGGLMEDDYTTGNATSFISASGNSLHVYGTEFETAGQTFTQAILLNAGSGEIHAFNQSPSVIPSDPTSFVNSGGTGDNFLIEVSIPSGSATPMQLKNSGYSIRERASSTTAVANTDMCYGDSTAHAIKCSYNAGTEGFLSLPRVVLSGTATMTTAAIGAGACGTTVTVAAANVATTDTITWAFNAAPAGTNAGIVAWPTAGNVNFAYCPGVAETPAAATINWRVVR